MRRPVSYAARRVSARQQRRRLLRRSSGLGANHAICLVTVRRITGMFATAIPRATAMSVVHMATFMEARASTTTTTTMAKRAPSARSPAQASSSAAAAAWHRKQSPSASRRWRRRWLRSVLRMTVAYRHYVHPATTRPCHRGRGGTVSCKIVSYDCSGNL